MEEQKKPLTKQEIERIAHEQASPALFASSETPQEINREKQYNKAMQENAPYLTLGAQLAGTMLLGAGIGWWIKSKTGDDIWLGIGAGIGAVLGLAYFILVVLRLEKEKAKKK
ncbi:MAG TPA: AtpZ/AtpI family protein [Candidatus Kapabacteria bacterium]|nr:AtpZ/AtpI family protein [Candidatus Kapabacteria bacterium]